MCLALVSMDDELASPQRPISALTVRKMASTGGVASTSCQGASSHKPCARFMRSRHISVPEERLRQMVQSS